MLTTSATESNGKVIQWWRAYFKSVRIYWRIVLEVRFMTASCRERSRWLRWIHSHEQAMHQDWEITSKIFFRIVPWWLVRYHFLERLRWEHTYVIIKKKRYALHAARESRQIYILGSRNARVLLSKKACRSKALCWKLNDCRLTSWNGDSFFFSKLCRPVHCF